MLRNIGNYRAYLVHHGDSVLGHVHIDDWPGLDEQLPEQRLVDLLVKTAHIDGGICSKEKKGQSVFNTAFWRYY